MNKHFSRPTLLFIGGHDPSGGAGLTADIETALAHGCRATSLVTCLTRQDSHNVQALHSQPAQQFAAQLDQLIADCRPNLIKVGLLGDDILARMLADRLSSLGIPLVLDPVLAAGGGNDLASARLIKIIREQWLPITHLLTPNRAEARRLGGTESHEGAAQTLLASGAQAVLLTGADEANSNVKNTLYWNAEPKTFSYPKLRNSYHGSGCTLAAACACQLALGHPLDEAARLAQDFTWASLRMGDQPGSGQHLPWRLPL